MPNLWRERETIHVAISGELAEPSTSDNKINMARSFTLVIVLFALLEGGSAMSFLGGRAKKIFGGSSEAVAAKKMTVGDFSALPPKSAPCVSEGVLL